MDCQLKSFCLIIVLVLCNEKYEAKPQNDLEINYRPQEDFTKNRKDDEMCEKQMLLLVDGFQRKEIWALKVFDSWGRSQAGLFSGNLLNFGHYEQCIQMKQDFDSDESGIFQGQHCLVFFKISDIVESFASNERDTILNHIFEIDILSRYMNVSKSKVGTAICIPSFCSTKMVRRIADSILANGNLKTTTDYKQGLYCNTINILEMRQIDMFAVLFFIFMLLLLILSTAYDLTMLRQNRKRKAIFSAFSVYTNGKKLFAINEPATSDVISSLYGIRALSILWIIHGHRMQIYSNFPIINSVQYREEWIKNWTSALSTSTKMAIDTFFVLSGLLSTKTILRKLDAKGRLSPSHLYIHRYLRITPVLAATIFCFMSLQRYFGDGPMNKSLIDQSLSGCNDYWYAALLHIQNFVNPNNLCLSHTWYLSPDFQLFLLSPFIVYPLWKYGRKVLMSLPFLTLASLIFIFIFTYYHEVNVFFRNNSNTVNSLYNAYIYECFFSRVCPYICGVMTAYILHINREAVIKISSHLNTILWFSSISTIFCIIIGNFAFHAKDNGTTKFLNSFYYAGGQLGWSLSIAWIIFACHLGNGGFVNSFLSLSIWKPIARIGLSLYLTHNSALIAVFGTQKQPGYFNEFLKTHHFLGDLGLSFCVAVLAFLTFEAPFLAIERSFHNKKIEK
ncbi:CLUMA_CG008562, isoform A [Clunio marinus]|uniref:CLUMA_CG008562, isoform A n=1 Tax=Clunio marinus TaxID=568069 RepID=A0A1J1I676_9DIPT|nr:CLUMA_CG008562, isoform A [Clunio marinus]